MIKTINLFVKQILFPKFCYGCHKYNTYICKKCLSKIIYKYKNTCIYCHKQNPFGNTCSRCARRDRLEGVYGLFQYDALGKVLVKKIKYRLVGEVINDLFRNIPAYFLGELAIYKRIVKDACLIPVPLHINRYRLRGFNQANLLAHKWGKLLGLKIKNNLIFRKIDTPPQAQIRDDKKRKENIKNAFDISDKSFVFGRDFIIIDDVCSSGETIKEVARMLKKFKAGKIYSLVLAR